MAENSKKRASTAGKTGETTPKRRKIDDDPPTGAAWSSHGHRFYCSNSYDFSYALEDDERIEGDFVLSEFKSLLKVHDIVLDLPERSIASVPISQHLFTSGSQVLQVFKAMIFDVRSKEKVAENLPDYEKPYLHARLVCNDNQYMRVTIMSLRALNMAPGQP